MKSLLQYILEKEEKNIISRQWIDDGKPCSTRDGRKVVGIDIDMSKIPNIVSGKVEMGDDVYDYQWLIECDKDNENEYDGKCIKSVDKLGNPKSPSKDDDLIQCIYNKEGEQENI